MTLTCQIRANEIMKFAFFLTSQISFVVLCQNFGLKPGFWKTFAITEMQQNLFYYFERITLWPGCTPPTTL
jgi:hypothetical protein